MDLQDKTYRWWKYWEVQSQICGPWNLQKEGIDYEETFVPVARYTSIRTIMALTTKTKWKLHQMDVKTTFLNGVIEEEVYIEQPQGFEVMSVIWRRIYTDWSKLQELGMEESIVFYELRFYQK